MNRALLVIDVQNEYFTGKLPVSYPPRSIDNILIAINSASIAGIPIVLIQHTEKPGSSIFEKGSREWEMHEQVAKSIHDLRIEKNYPGSFTGTILERWLREKGIDTVVISGYMTQLCCDTTARQAHHLGFKVEFLSDATGTLPISNIAGAVSAEILHKATLVTQGMIFSKVLQTSDWIKSILSDS